jgi:hypothetical protein
MHVVAGSRKARSAARSELESFWAPLGKKLRQTERTQNAGRVAGPAKAGIKRPRPPSAPAPPTELAEWLLPNKKAQATERKHQHGTALMEMAQGKKNRLMMPSACVNFHPFTETLRQWEEGVPVDCGEDWTMEQLEAAIQQGPHKLALDPESIALIEEDVTYQVRAGYAQVVDWSWLKNHLPPQLKVSPIAVISQANCRGRMILDLPFSVIRRAGKQGRKQRGERDIMKESVNDSTARMAPEAPVKELGNVLAHLLQFMQDVPAEEHIQFAKIDLADGYWRMIVEK